MFCLLIDVKNKCERTSVRKIKGYLTFYVTIVAFLNEKCTFQYVEFDVCVQYNLIVAYCVQTYCTLLAAKIPEYYVHKGGWKPSILLNT